MLTQPLRCFRMSTFVLRPFASFSSSSSSDSITPYFPPSPPSESHDIASSFQDWFRTSRNPNFDLIFQTLNSLPHLDFSQTDLGLKLTESLVLDVLRYKSSDVLSCLKFFDWASRQPHFKHTHATYVAIFKIASRAKLTSLMLDWLDGFRSAMFVQRARLTDILVVGYAFAGELDVALHLFGKIRFSGSDLDVVSYHILLNALIDGGLFDAAKVIVGQIKARGHHNEVTNSLLVKSLCKQGKLVEAEEFMRDMLQRGDTVSGHLFSTLVSGLCRAKMISHAGDLIHEFAEKGTVPVDVAYGIWIRALVRSEKVDEALQIFNAKKSFNGRIPNVHRYNTLINRLLKEDRLLEVCDLLIDMKENNVAPDKVTMNAVLCFFCKAGMTDVALELYKGPSEFMLTINSFNYIVNTLCRDGNTDEAYLVVKNSLSLGLFPWPRTFSILADALCREGKLDKMKDLLMSALERKSMPSKSTYEKFIRALCRAERVEDGYLIHEELNKLNQTLSDTTYTYLIDGFNKACRGDLAGRLLIEMQEKGHKPHTKLFKAVARCVCEMEDDKISVRWLKTLLSRYGHDLRTYSYFIRGAGHARKPELGRAVFEMMEKNGFVPNLETDIFMLQCYLNSHRVSDAVIFFHDIPRRRKLGRQLYDTMVVGLCKAGRADYAASCLRQAKKKGLNSSLQCYEELVKLYCAENKFDQVIIIINELEKAGRNVSSFIGNCLLLHSFQSGDVYRAWLRSRHVYEKSHSSARLGQLVAVFSARIRMDCKIEDLEEIIRKCFPPDLYTYNMMLRKLSIDHIDKACLLFKRMCQKGIKPNRWTYDILVRGLYKHGRIAEGHLWAKEMHRQGYMLFEAD